MSDYIVPFGPQHPAIKEPVSLRLELEGDCVVGVDLQLGYVHRGVEKLFEGKNINNGLYLAERLCGICSYAHSSAYARAMEPMLDIDPSERVRYLRTIMAELERIHSHLLWAGFMFHELGLETMFHYCWREREKILDIFEQSTGNRVHHGFAKLGSVRFDIPDLAAVAAAAESVLPTVELAKKELRDGVVRARLKDVGSISKAHAEKVCLVGPPARACGIHSDIRKLDPYDAYALVKFDEPLRTGGDSLARAEVRLDEIGQSAKIIRQCADAAPVGPIPSAPLRALAGGEGFGRVEAPRGEDFHYYLVKDSIITRAKIRTPTLAVFPIVRELLVGSQVGDVPVIIASVDPCIGCMERVMVVKDGVQAVMDEQEFRRRYCD